MGNFKYYEYDNKKYNRVTSILGVLPMPWLVPWVKKEARVELERYVKGLKCEGVYDNDLLIYDINTCLDAHKIIGQTAMDIGTLVHEMTDVWDTGIWDDTYVSYLEFLFDYYGPYANMFNAYGNCLKDNEF